MEKQEVLGIAIQICNIVAKLHHLQSPMIHRDIKPQNLILDQYGEIHLIDFEASRNFDRSKRRDTKFYGTEATAAPEQYGYAQTDVRTDIYAFGKVPCYLLTGDYQVEECEQMDGRLSIIVKKCCAFDPKKRYQSIEEVRRMLEEEQKKTVPGRKKKFLRLCGLTSAVFCIFLAGIIVGNYWAGKSMSALVQKELQKQTVQRKEGGSTQQDGKIQSIQQNGQDQNVSQNGEDEAEDGENLLRRAAAASLNKEKMTEEDLEDVVRIAVMGTQVYDMTKNFVLDDMFHEDENYVLNAGHGTIADISLLAKMPNLSEVYLYNQQIQDIEALEGLPIRKLYFSGNQIEDFRVVEKLPKLRELCITKNPVRYLPDFKKCLSLTTLIINEISVTDLNCLKGAAVEQIAMRRLNVANGDYSFLEDLPRLNRLMVWNPSEETMQGIARLTELRQLEIFDYHKTEINFVLSLENIRAMQIQSSYDLDLSPILDCKNLDNLCVNEDQASYIKEHNPNYSGNLNVLR